MSRPAHPGTIRFIDQVAQTDKLEPADQVPDSVAFVTHEGQLVPVVKVVLSGAGDRREVRSYGADDRLLSTSYLRAGR